MKYSELKNNIYNYYKRLKKIDIDNISDVNDYITDKDLGKNYFENNIDEFFCTVAMCNYMIENNLYDEYFFNVFPELLEEYNNTKSIMNNEEEELNKDIDAIKDYLKKEEIEKEYYDKLSEIYDK